MLHRKLQGAAHSAGGGHKEKYKMGHKTKCCGRKKERKKVGKTAKKETESNTRE